MAKNFTEIVNDISSSLKLNSFYITRKQTKIRGPIVFKLLNMSKFITNQPRKLKIELVCCEGFMKNSIHTNLLQDGLTSDYVSHELSLQEVIHLKIIWGNINDKIIKD